MRRDKYWGRALTEGGLREALRDFFAAGAALRERVVRRVLRDLDALRRAIAKQTSYRFYSWSVSLSSQLSYDYYLHVDHLFSISML